MEKVSASELRALAERVMAATADQQKDVLDEVLNALDLYTGPYYRVARLIDAGAYESAAVSLVPEGWHVASLRQSHAGDAWGVEMRGPGLRWAESSWCHSEALARAGAALLARAAMMESNDEH